jgi:hypothetical protein
MGAGHIFHSPGLVSYRCLPLSSNVRPHMQPSLKTRKPVHRLTVADLEAFPVWEFASDEEDVEGMDETWVKPAGHVLPENEAALTVATVFKMSCGLVYPGLMWCNTYAEFEVTAIALLTEHDRLIFSEGTPRQHIAEALTELNLAWDQVFPVQYSTRAKRSSTGKPEQGSFTLPKVTGLPGAA